MSHEIQERIKDHTPKTESKLHTVRYFKTAHSSVYTRNPDGKYTRQRADGREQKLPKKDITVFTDLIPEEEEQVLGAVLKTYVWEERQDGTTAIVSDIEQVTNPQGLFLVIIKEGGRIVFKKPTSLKPKVGSYPFESGDYTTEDGRKDRYVHYGNKVTEIKYENG